MSGPKCNQYVIIDEGRLEELRREQERRLEEERRLMRERIERERIERERIERERAQRENNLFTDALSELEASEKEFLAMKEEFDLAYADYLSACALSGSEPVTMDFDMDKISVLAEMTRKEEEKALEKAKAEYINQSINRCMVDSGFDPIFSTKGKSAMTVYDFGNNTGISVVSSGNRVSFEVAGLSETDRQPVQNEKNRIVSRMEGFCKVFDSLEEKLREKGIGTENIYRMPAHEKYARIINIPKKKARIETQAEETEAIRTRRKEKNGN